MRLARASILVVISMAAVALTVMPAFAWYWPIFGFSDIGMGWPSNSSSGSGDVIREGPQAPSPFQYDFQPAGRAELIMPGYPYYGGGVHHGSINFGLFGRGSPGFPFPFGSGYVWGPSPSPTAEPENETNVLPK